MILLLLLLPIRDVFEFEDIVNDVQSHLEAGHSFGCDNPITTVHECTHGINMRLTNLNKKPCFYVLNDKMFIVESNLTLKQVAEAVPVKLRGSQYQRYLVKLQRYWNGGLRIWENREGTYVLDELSAYLNSLQARFELKVTGRKEIASRVVEFIIYSVYIKSGREYIQYQINRAVKLNVIFNPDELEYIKENGYEIIVN